MTSLKTCTKCGQTKPATREWFHVDKRIRGGLRSQCKECAVAYMRGYCTGHREREAARSRAWYKINSEKSKEYNRQWAEANRERSREIKRRWEENHPEKVGLWTKTHPEEAAKMRREWRQANQDKCRAIRRNRKARKRSNGGKHTAEDIVQIYADQDGFCFYCGTELGENYHVDHMTPLIRGGSNGPENLCCACPQCNMSKNSQTASEFLAKLAS